jgi:L-threonylcarbamoyladenylate synthase
MPIFEVQDAATLDQAIRAATEALNSGGIVLYPTDTVYALAANALDVTAIEKVYAIKGRDYSKPIHVIVRDITQAEEYVILDDLARKLEAEFLPGALTIVAPKRLHVPALLTSGQDTLGIRIPDNEVCKRLAAAVDFPLTTTSANRSAMPNTYHIRDVQAQLQDDFNQIDVVIDSGQIPPRAPSTVVSVRNGQILLIREGAIPFSEILARTQYP